MRAVNPATIIPVSPVALEKVRLLAYAKARNSFYPFRQLMNPKMKTGWFTYKLAEALQEFYDDYVAGKRPILLINTPPQHGKSITSIDLSAWMAGQHPELKIIYAAFSDRLCRRANSRMQLLLDSPKYQEIFPSTKLSSTRGGAYQRNTELLDFVATGGYFRTTTVRGPINGEGMDFGILDDPLKGRAEAQSEVERDKIWEWLTDDLFGRFSEFAGLLLIMTRWHVDDPAGRLIENFGNRLKIVRFPAIAEVDEEYRLRGEPLFPEFKSLEFLEIRKGLLSRASWESVWQQNPVIIGGTLFPVEKLKTIPFIDRSQIVSSVRSWDKAGCLIAGTKIATSRGDVPIEQIKVGDLVATRQGFKRVTRAWLTKYIATVCSVTFSDGSVISGTPDHRLITADGREVELQNLQASDKAVVWKKSSFGSKVKNTLVIKMQNILTKVGILPEGYLGRENPPLRLPCIEKSGNFISEIYPRVITFTTKTGTGIITRSKTLNVYLQLSIESITTQSLNTKPSCGVGIRTTLLGVVRGRLRLGDCARVFVELAGRSLLPEALKLCIVGSPSVLGSASGQSVRTDIVRGAVQRFWDVLIHSAKNVFPKRLVANVYGVGKFFGLIGPQHQPNFVVEAVKDFGNIPVYDLTVEVAHEFFANGVLVHNSEGTGAYTAGVLMHRLANKTFLIENVERGQWSALAREQRIRQIAEMDRPLCRNYTVVVEQEPGSGGKESAESTVRNLAGFKVILDKVVGKGSKEIRAEPLAVQVQAGNVFLAAGAWQYEYIHEAGEFPNGKFKDQIDASSAAFNYLTGGHIVDTSLAWVS